MSMPRRSGTANSHQTIDSGTVDCPLPHENEPHQTFANRDPRLFGAVARFLTGWPVSGSSPAHQHDQQARSRMRSDRSSNDDARVPDPSILTPPAGQSRDLQGTTKLEYRSRSALVPRRSASRRSVRLTPAGSAPWALTGRTLRTWSG